MDISDKSIYINEYGIDIYKNSKGEYHRLDGPAIKFPNGETLWYKEGKLHRLDGPSAEYTNGDKIWYKKGLMHRTDGPAIQRENNEDREWYKELFILGKDFEEKEFNSWVERIKCFL